MTQNLLPEFKASPALSLGVELELQLLSLRDYDLTRAATDLLHDLDYDQRFGEIKLEVTESMIEVSTLPQTHVDGIHLDLQGLRAVLLERGTRNNIAVCGGGTHPYHHWPDRRICPGERYDQTYRRYGYLAKQFTVFGQHVHLGCESADDAVWLTQALCPYVPAFIALSAASPYVDGVDTFFQSARLNAVSAFPLSGQCPPLRDWTAFVEYFHFMADCGIVSGIKDLYWDVRPKPEFGTVEIRVFDTPLTLEQASSLTAFAQCVARWLLRTRPEMDAALNLHVARYNKYQACRYGLDAKVSDPLRRTQIELRVWMREILSAIEADAAALACQPWIDRLRALVDGQPSDAAWLRGEFEACQNLNDVVRAASRRFSGEAGEGNPAPSVPAGAA